jgi:peptide-methionine (S)-S-oxide reductase
MIEKIRNCLFIAAALAVVITLSPAADKDKKPMKESAPATTPPAPGLERLTMGGGCFWCMEAVFQRLPGVKKVVSGFAGGTVPNPTYEQVCTGETGHAEVVQIDFDAKLLPLAKLLEVFFAAHDPTTPNRQGHDSGTQYRSVLFYENAEQKAAMEKAKVAAQPDYSDPIVTQIVPFKAFYSAEAYHQDYFNQNSGTNPYCSIVIRPKLQKLIKENLIQAEPAKP